MDFPKNYHRVIIEKVPCAFAPSVKGGLGLHYTVVVLDADDNVLYTGSECGDQHGAGVQVIQELGGNEALCHATPATFQEGFRELNQSRPVFSQQPEVAHLGQLMARVFDGWWNTVSERHNKRYVRKVMDEAKQSMNKRHAHLLQATVDRVAASLLKLPVELIETPVTCTVEYPPVFEVIDYWCGSARLRVGATTIARRSREEHGGSWEIDEPEVIAWAQENHSNDLSTPVTHCVFCNAEFTRMTKHTAGAAHVNRVLEVVKIVCKATSRMGLQLLNNPRTRSVFIKQGVL